MAMAQDRVVLARLRNHFYRDSYRRLMLLLMVSLGLNIIFALASSYLFLHKPKPEFFATSPDGKLVSMIPLNQPFLPERQLKVFANQAALSSTSMDYMNYRKDLRAARRFYTPEGFNEYLRFLGESGRIDFLRNNGLVVKSEVNAVPAICQHGEDNSSTRRYTWLVDVPLAISYDGQSAAAPGYMVARLKIVRVSTAETPQGVLVRQANIFSVGRNFKLCTPPPKQG